MRPAVSKRGSSSSIGCSAGPSGARRRRRRRMSAVLAATRWSHVVNAASPRKPASFSSAARNVSCTTSSASTASRSRCWASSLNAAPSPLAASATRSLSVGIDSAGGRTVLLLSAPPPNGITTRLSMRRAKIVATLGPASTHPETLQKLLEHGVDVARLNFSHGRLEDHAEVLDKIRAASRRIVKAVAVLQDLQGPKIRTGPLKAGKVGVLLDTGCEITITTDGDFPGDEKLVSTTYRHLAEDVRPGDRLLVDDGLIELRVLSTDGVRVCCEVLEGGVLKEHKGINLPGVALRAQVMSEKDERDLAFGLAHGIDYVALSFVRTPEDIALCREEMERCGRVVPIIAKIEKPEALENIDAIIA